MWDLPRPGLEPVSPALAGRLSTTAPPGKPLVPFNVRCYLETNLGTGGCVFSSEACIFIMSAFKGVLEAVETLYSKQSNIE